MSLMRHMRPAKLAPRDRLLHAAATVWAANPSAPLETIAEAAGVGRATLHRHFPSRLELMRAAALHGMDALAAAIDVVTREPQPPEQALDALIEMLVPFGDRLHFLLVTGDLLGDEALTVAERAVDAPIRRVLDAAAATGALRSEVPAGWRFRALEALLYAAWTAVAEGSLARQDAAPLVRDAFRRGFASGAEA